MTLSAAGSENGPALTLAKLAVGLGMPTPLTGGSVEGKSTGDPNLK